MILSHTQMPATQVGVVQMELPQSMVDSLLKNKIAILVSWNYWQLSFFFNLPTKIYAASVICVMSDSATAISYINHMSRTKSARCNDSARETWDWVLGKGIWISTTHVPLNQNTEAEQMSHTFTDHTEWMLSDEIFKNICDIWETPDIDLFANRLNHKVTEYF